MSKEEKKNFSKITTDKTITRDHDKLIHREKTNVHLPTPNSNKEGEKQ